MANKTISGLTTAPSIDRAADLIEVELTVAATSNKITPNSLLGITGDPVGHTDTQTLSNKTIGSTNSITQNDSTLIVQNTADTTKKAKFSAASISAGNTRTYTLPDVTDTITTNTATQTLTNKTLTSPAINTATISNPTLTVDAIAEHTAANGVTVDGLNIKDGALVTAASVPNSVLGNTGSFSSAWAWTSWTPSWTNLTVGAATQSFKYIVIGKAVFIRGYITLNGSTMGSGPVFTLPLTAKDTNKGTASGTAPIGVGRIEDNATASFEASVELTSTTLGTINVKSAGGTYVGYSQITSTVPMTWANGDEIRISALYEAA